MDNKKKLWLVAAIIAVILLVFFGYRWYANMNTPAVVPVAQAPASSNTAATAAPANTSTAPKPVAPTDKDTAYEAALKKYPNRIQFKDCHGVVAPAMSGSLVVKQGTKVMFDNRDAAAHTIAMKGVSVKVGALNFAVVTASTLGTYNITCDGGGAASINVEK